MVASSNSYSPLLFAARIRARIKEHDIDELRRTALFMIMNCPEISSAAEQFAQGKISYKELTVIITDEYACYGKRFEVDAAEISELIAAHAREPETAGFTLVESSLSATNLCRIVIKSNFQ